MLQISRFEIHTAFNGMICFHNSSNVENHYLNCACQCCAKHDGKFFINGNEKAVFNKACLEYAILHVKSA